MGCNTCGNKKKGVFGNLAEAMAAQPKKLEWFKDGITGLVRTLGGVALYDADGIISNRNACSNCEFATRNDQGKLGTLSQCMAPNKDGAPCACFILAKTENGECPLGKFTAIKISARSKSGV